MSVDYSRVNWQQAPSTSTPINATNLNKMDKGIADAVNQANANETAINKLNSDLNAMRPNYVRVGIATGDDTLTLPANYIVTKLGTITIPPKCVATIMSRANVRTGNSDIEFALGVNTEDIYSLGWGATHKNAPLYCVMSDTWIAINESTSSIVCYLFGRTSIQTTLMYAGI